MLLTNCENEAFDKFDEPINQVSYKVTSLDKLTHLIPVVENVKKVKPKESAFTKSNDDVLTFDNINIDEIIQYTNQTGASTYTFKIENDTEETINFENLYLIEVDNGYIAYILSFEPDPIWFYSNLYFDGTLNFNINTYQGEITKYSLEREIIWTTDNDLISKSSSNNSSLTSRGYFDQVCTISPPDPCVEGNHSDEQGWVGCHYSDGNYNVNCETVWVSGGIDTGDNPDTSGDDTEGGGGASSTDTCTDVTGTSIEDSLPLTGTSTDCAPNTTIGVAAEKIVVEECQKIPNLFTANPTYRQKIVTLSTKVDDNKEHSHSFHLDNSENQVEGVVGSGGIDLPDYASAYVAYTHTHDSFGLDGTGTLSVFSMEDLISYATFTHFNKLNSGMFVAFLATSKGTKYALTINDPTKLIDLFYNNIIGNAIPNTFQLIQKSAQSKIKTRKLYDEYFDKDNVDAKLKVSSTNTENDLKEFLNFMAEADAGITLFETTDNFDTFNELTLQDDGTVNRKPACN